MRLILVVGVVAMAAVAHAGPFRWQAADGTRVEAELVSVIGKPPHLAITKPAPQVIELAGAAEGAPLEVRGYVDDLVILGADRGWRLEWKNARFIETGRWQPRAKYPPPWASPRNLRKTHIAFEEARQLLRFEDTIPGLDRFFADNTIVLTTNNRQPTKITGSDLLARWQRDGFPLVRGPLKTAGPKCASLPVNWSFRGYIKKYEPRNDPKGPRFAAGCMGEDLRFEKIDLTVPP